MSDHQPFALSLSGGGLSAVAYAGFADTLRQHQLTPAHYAGLSGGAFLAIFLASGLTAADIFDFFSHLRTLKLLNLHFSKLEIVDHHKLTELVRQQLPIKNFEDLPTPALVFASDLVKKEPVVINHGDIASAIVASSCVFPLLQPYRRQGLLLGDGGFTVYYGAKYLRELGIPKVIGVDVTGLTEGSVRGLFSFLYKQINSTVTSNSRYELNAAPVDLDIRLTFPSPTIFSLPKEAPGLYHLGSQTAEKYLRQIKKAVKTHD